MTSLEGERDALEAVLFHESDDHLERGGLLTALID